MAQTVRLQDAIDSYLAFRKADGAKPATRRNDDLFLRSLLVENGNVFVKTISIVHVERLYTAKADTWSIATRNLARAHLMGFFKYCRARKWIPADHDPVANFRKRKVPEKRKLRIPAQRFGALLDAAEHPRDRAFIACGLYLFLRGGETCAIRLRDVELDAGYVNVHIPKSEKQDRMPISLELDQELRRYLVWYTEVHGDLRPEWYLTPAKAGGTSARSESGQYLAGQQQSISRLRPWVRMTQPQRPVQQALEAIGYPVEREGGHTLRRSGARAYFDQLCQDGYSRALKRVSAMLHHDHVTTTEIYLGLDIEIEERDADLRGKPMFPSLMPTGNVVPLERAL